MRAPPKPLMGLCVSRSPQHRTMDRPAMRYAPISRRLALKPALSRGHACRRSHALRRPVQTLPADAVLLSPVNKSGLRRSAILCRRRAAGRGMGTNARFKLHHQRNHGARHRCFRRTKPHLRQRHLAIRALSVWTFYGNVQQHHRGNDQMEQQPQPTAILQRHKLDSHVLARVILWTS
jgi:hypothetical protein